MLRPEIGEYSPNYLHYLKLLPDGDILEILEQQGRKTLELFNNFSEKNALYRYDPDKWCIKEIMQHLIDTERVFAYRALRISRGDTMPLPSFDQDEFIRNSNVLQRLNSDLANEYQSVRNASLTLFRSLDEEMSLRMGTASGNLLTVRTIPCIIAGHELHHDIIAREKYLKVMPPR
jgi:DinB superfamily